MTSVQNVDEKFYNLIGKNQIYLILIIIYYDRDIDGC